MSYHLFSTMTRTAKKQHRCIWCWQAIPPGTLYTDERSVYDGRMQRHRWHPECITASYEYLRTCGDNEFTPGENPRGKARED